MLVTLKWLSDFVDLNGISAKEIADTFTMIGFEVEEMRELGKGMEKVVVGKIEKLDKHPNADKLQICTINVGDKSLQIITGATNVHEGDFIPVALDGADLPNGVKIKPTLMRGVESCGMLCSGEELKITDDVYPGAEVDGILILNPSGLTVGENIAKVLGYDDVVYDISVLANRPDCQSVMGLARELAAALDREFKLPNMKYHTHTSDKQISLVVKNEACPYYLAGSVKDITLGPAPKWMRDRLRAVGVNTHNNLVDVTNYVLFEMGQPLHAFDDEKIGGGKIVVRKAKAGEKVLALNGETYELDDTMLVIADEKQPMGIAGIKGGEEFSVSDTTQNIILESATFARKSIRDTSRKLGLRTDAEARYERGVEAISCKYGLERALALIDELGMGKIYQTVANVQLNFERRKLELSLDYITKLLGIEVPQDQILKILKNLDLEPNIKDNILTCSVPPIRVDITRPADIAEEIIRMYGCDKLNSTNLETTTPTEGGYAYMHTLCQNLALRLMATGAHEVVTYSFISPEASNKLLMGPDSHAIKIRNPLSLEYSVMRTQMISSLLNVAESNLSRKNSEFAVFETGRIYKKSNDKIEETNVLAYLDIKKSSDFFSIKSVVEMLAQSLGINFNYQKSATPYLHPNINAEITIGNRVVGRVGKVHPAVTKNFGVKTDAYYFELELDSLPAKKVKKVKAPAKFPASERDLAVVVALDVPVGDMIQEIRKAGGTLCESVEFFDVYTGEQVRKGCKSVAFRMIFRKSDATLTQEEVNACFDKILTALKNKFFAEIRAL